MNIYNIDQFQKNEYSWNPVSKRRARNYFIKLGVGVALIFALYGLLGIFCSSHMLFLRRHCGAMERQWLFWHSGFALH